MGLRESGSDVRVGSSSLLLWLAIAQFAGTAGSALAQGGPPLLTDDPGTPGDGNWELNLAVELVDGEDETEWAAPLVDLNYGVGERVQLKFEVPWLFLEESGHTRDGLGPSSVGVKWRFYDAGEGGRSLSIYPQLEFPSPGSSADRGLVEDDTSLFLPVELVQPLGPVSMNVEVGYLVSDLGDEVVLGVAVGRELTERLELVAEVWGAEPTSGGDGIWVANLGLRVDLQEGLALLVAGGTGVAGAHQEAEGLGFLGLQMTF